MDEPTFAEMFAGIGGFRLGLERSGFKCVWANEIDKYASQIYQKNFGEKELQQGDIRDIDTAKIPNIDLLCGGFPCQSFSIAGQRKGTKEARGTLFAQIVRVATAKRPKLLLLENVKGLLSSDNGRDFAKILRSLGNLGYLLEWQVLNSKCWVPQNRERIFIVGHLGTGCTRQIFPIPSDGGEDSESGEIVGCLQGGGHSGGLHSNMTAISHSVRNGGRGSLDRHTWDLVCVELRQSGFREHRNDGLSPTLTRKMGTGGNNVPIVAQALQTDGMLRSGSSFGTNNPQSSRNIRRLTPTECETLQGFPKKWTEGVSDTQRYKCLGNAVTVDVIQFLGERLREILD